MSILGELFAIFFKIGLFTFGGGYAMISIIEDICVSKKKWITHDEMMEITVIAESTPGPVAINCATYIGYKKAGIRGAIVATLGVVLPSFVIIYIISVFLDHFLEYTIVIKALKGIRIAVGILIVNAAIRIIKKSKWNALSILILGGSFALVTLIDVFGFSFSTIYIMLLSGAVGICFSLIRRNDEVEEK